ncbi:alpha/beta fold hydrolase [Natronorubrum sp. FCH18a]|uniref:alpha/beta fold hydrolase n=1 Tax=Natronorubrum sp. FCH18a TaxID=3447018 RepID=UPI003F5124EF
MSAEPSLRHDRSTVNDVQLHYVTAGEGKPLVLLHGWPQTWYEWREVIPKFAKDYTVIAPDLRGMGDSEKPRSGYDKKNVGTDIHELVQELGYEEAAVVGHDWGMPVAYAYAAQYRNEVEALVGMDCLLPGVREEEDPLNAFWHFGFHGLTDLPEELIVGNEDRYFPYFYNNYAFDSSAIDQETIEEYLRCYSGYAGVRGGSEYYRAYDTDVKNFKELSKEPLEIPVLALGSVFQDRVGKDMKEVANDVRTDVVEQSGHWIPEERPDYFVSRVREFLDDVNY